MHHNYTITNCLKFRQEIRLSTRCFFVLICCGKWLATQYHYILLLVSNNVVAIYDVMLNEEIQSPGSEIAIVLAQAVW